MFDFFLSHASEDKDEIARPLYEALIARNVSVWFDEAVLELGDSLRQKIDEGLAKCRFGIVILSPHFLRKHWPQQELNGLSARETATGEKAIIPVWHNLDGGILSQYSPTLADRVAGRSDEGMTMLIQKIMRVLSARPAHSIESVALPVRMQPPQPADGRFFNERSRELPETDLVKLLLTKPRWRISICPVTFKDARFRDVGHCTEFVPRSEVRYATNDSYPLTRTIEQDPGGRWIRCEFTGGDHIECWGLFRSGQFIHNRALPEIKALGNDMHYLHILQIVSQSFVFAANMAREGVLSPSAVVSIELLRVAGRGLVVPPDVEKRCWAQQADITVARLVQPQMLVESARDLAIDVTLEIFGEFGWQDAPREVLVKRQIEELR